MRQMNVVGKPYDQKGHVRFEAAGAGDGSLDTAPALDPTCALQRHCVLTGESPVVVTTRGPRSELPVLPGDWGC
jgi:hypothetical protein